MPPYRVGSQPGTKTGTAPQPLEFSSFQCVAQRQRLRAQFFEIKCSTSKFRSFTHTISKIHKSKLVDQCHSLTRIQWIFFE